MTTPAGTHQFKARICMCFEAPFRGTKVQRQLFLSFLPGLPTIWAISRLFETTRITNPTLEVMKEIARRTGSDAPEAPRTGSDPPNVVGVMRALNMHISPLFYERARFRWPLVLCNRVGHVGYSSLSNVQDLKDEADGQIVATSERLVVFMDKVQGKTVELPEERKDFLRTVSSKETPLRIDPLEPPKAKAFNFDVNVKASDTDHLYHVNQASWLRFCLDCAAAATQQGFYGNVQADPLALPVRQVEVLYSAEGFAGDNLTVSSWESEEDDATLCFSVKKQDKQCTSCAIKFDAEPQAG